MTDLSSTEVQVTTDWFSSSNMLDQAELWIILIFCALGEL